MCQSCSSPANAFLHDLPKVEHHIHIEGSFEPDLLFRMAARNGISLPSPMYTTIEALEERYKNFANLDDFLNYFNVAMAALITEDDFSELAYEYMVKANRDGLVHAEIFFDPQAHVERNIPIDTCVNGLHAGLAKGTAEFGITTLLTACFVKHLPVESAMGMLDYIKPFVANGKVVGLGADSTELGNRPIKYKGVYEKATKETGFKRLTIHAGEEDTHEVVHSAIFDLGLSRVDHGVRSTDSPELLNIMAKKKIFLTVCPLSNVRLRVHKSVAESPIPKLLAAGVPFSINSDDPSYFGGYILDNYIAVQDNFHFDKPTWRTIITNTVTYSWCSDERKAEILAQLDEVMAKWEGKDI